LIVIDTSAVMAILQSEPMGFACQDSLETADEVLISSGTLAEALIVGHRRGISAAVQALVDNFGFAVEPVTAQTARRVGLAHARWGKGVHPASLNFGDCFAYALASERDLPLLYVGGDFARTDIRSVIDPTA
jgi:ribonuclease VapC